jgi:protein MpaA
MRCRSPIVMLASAVAAAAVGSAGPGCSVFPSVPVPWEASENPAAEPQPIAPIPDPAKWDRIGSSVRGKALAVKNVGSGPRRIYIIGGYHGDMPEGPQIAAALPEALGGLAGLEGCTVRVLRDMNPDGTASRTRGNTRGVDLNRNWPAPDFKPDARAAPRPASEIETAAVQKDLRAFNPDVVIVLTSSARGPVAAFEGGSPLIAREFASAARSLDPRFRLVTDLWKPSPGSVESYVSQTMHRPVLSVEVPRGASGPSAVNAIAAGIAGIGAAAVK